MRFTFASFVVMCSGAQENDICNSVHGTVCTDPSVHRHETGVWTHEACCQACRGRVGCRAWSWNFKDGHCHFKKSCNQQVSNPAYHSGMINTSPKENRSYIIEEEKDVMVVQYSGDGKHLASSGWFDTLHIWDTTTGEFLQGLSDERCHGVFSPAWSGDGKHLAAVCDGCSVRIWDVATGKIVRRMGYSDTDYNRTLTTDCFGSVAYSPDSTRLVIGSNNGIIRVFDATANKTLNSWKGYSCPDNVNQYCELQVRYSPDGKHVASQFTIDFDVSIIGIWDATTGKLLHDFGLRQQQGSLTAYSRDGNQLTVMVYNIIKILNSTTGEVVQTLRHGIDPSYCVTSVDYSADGKYIASASADRTVRIWDATTGKSLHILKAVGIEDSMFTSVAYSADGRQLAAGNHDSNIYIWDLAHLLTSSPTLVAGPYAAHYAEPVVV